MQERISSRRDTSFILAFRGREAARLNAINCLHFGTSKFVITLFLHSPSAILAPLSSLQVSSFFHSISHRSLLLSSFSFHRNEIRVKRAP